VNQGQEELDVANKSLTEALGVSFSILKIIMVVLVILFIGSGVFSVQSEEQALVLRLGKIRGIGESRLLGPGFHWAFPEPIDEIVRIPVKKVQSLGIESFWYFMTEEERLGKVTPTRYAPATMNPTKDGYCLTRSDSISGMESTDYNIVHSKWQLTYRIDNPERFFRNIYYRVPSPGEDFFDVTADVVEPLLQSMAADAIVTTMVKYSIDEAIVSNPDIPNNVKRLLQRKLDQIDSGITVVGMQIAGKITWPRQVDDAFQASNKASQEKQKLITEAKAYSEKVLNEAGGPDAEQILVALKAEDLPEEQRKSLLSRLSGSSQEQIAHARAYRTKVVETAKASSEYLGEILPVYRERPKLVLQKIYQDAIEEVLNNAEEKIFIQPAISGKSKELRILINRDPLIGKPKKSE
jgi:membrane protease subunit HflK